MQKIFIKLADKQESVKVKEQPPEKVYIKDSCVLSLENKISIESTDEIVVSVSPQDDSIYLLNLSDAVRDQINNSIKVGANYPTIDLSITPHEKIKIFLENEGETKVTDLNSMSSLWTKFYNIEQGEELPDAKVGDYICENQK
jgi:hypothetical protein